MTDIQKTEDLTPKGLVTDKPLDHHRLAMLPREQAAVAALTAMDAMASLSAEEMTMGAAVLFAVYCRRTGLDPADVHTMAMRVIDCTEKGDHRTDNALQVLRDFCGARVVGHAVTVQ